MPGSARSPDVGLVTARTKAAEYRALVGTGVDPIERTWSLRSAGAPDLPEKCGPLQGQDRDALVQTLLAQ